MISETRAPVAGAGDDLLEFLGVALELGVRVDLRRRHPGGPGGGVFARSAAEDQRVEQRVGTQSVASMDRDAGDLAGRVEAVDGRPPVNVRLDAAHDVVLSGTDHDRFTCDVHAGEVAAEVDDLAQRLERPLARDDGDVEVDARLRRDPRRVPR